MMRKFNVYLGAAAGAWALVILVVAAELAEPFKKLLTDTFSHHWVGKAVIMFLTFVILGLLMRNKHSVAGVSNNKLAWYGVLAGLLVIFIFYVVEFF